MKNDFDKKNIFALVDRVAGLWCPPNGTENFKRLYAEAVVRQNLHDNEFQYQLMDGGRLMSVACASKKGEKNSCESWWNEQFKKLSAEQKNSFSMSREYINFMNEKTFCFMSEQDLKLDLFVSIEKGWGKKVLDIALDGFKKAGLENMFLWTDCDCNVDWYVSHGYELVNEDVYEPFSSVEEYRTFVFKKTV